jgi:hypothetical protein
MYTTTSLWFAIAAVFLVACESSVAALICAAVSGVMFYMRG